MEVLNINKCVSFHYITQNVNTQKIRGNYLYCVFKNWNDLFWNLKLEVWLDIQVLSIKIKLKSTGKMCQTSSIAEWTIKKAPLRDTAEQNRSYIVQRETIQCCVCAAQKTTQSHFLLFSLLFGPTEKVATEIALCSAQSQLVHSSAWNHWRSKSKNHLLCPRFTAQRCPLFSAVMCRFLFVEHLFHHQKAYSGLAWTW